MLHFLLFSDKTFGKFNGKENYASTGLNTFSELHHITKQEKKYKPEAFADQHVVDVLKENEELKKKV